MRPLTSSLDFISRYELNTSKFDGWMVLEDNEVFQDMRAPKIVGLPPSSTFPSFKPMVLGWSLLFLGFTLRHWRYRKNRLTQVTSNNGLPQDTSNKIPSAVIPAILGYSRL
ncbi:uncharacterized protein LOC110008524 isoform X3 [Amborella trichopoda]|uniref:uncharacterized protein LOC110008524 isoform X3 n=1 Tax=Amborella trichopoda TaxID=13333 RepID=UPI0009BE61BD|nr:uncharacterized protein LOC110008524 isoform X3 [Amborella trichopoda]|eukprot:XP_020532083.1 uncharacterized protein LOC110008524 isoform X3 [Amborella trichopoda]